jgi:hypothetical protein
VHRYNFRASKCLLGRLRLERNAGTIIDGAQ